MTAPAGMLRPLADDRDARVDVGGLQLVGGVILARAQLGIGADFDLLIQDAAVHLRPGADDRIVHDDRVAHRRRLFLPARRARARC